MKKYLLIFAVAFMFSCSGTKKVSELKKEFSKDTISETTKSTKIDSLVLNKNTNLNEDEEVFYEPINKSYPMYIEGIPYENVVVKKVKKKSLIEVVDQINVVKEKVETALKESHNNMVESDKKLYKEYSTFSYVWILLIVIILYVIYRVHKISRINL